jgi:hypothetical protein
VGKILASILLILGFFVRPVLAQDIEVEGYFMQDSAKLGERVAYVLKAKYRPGTNIIFPDSSYNFEPFVLLEKKSFISSTTDDVTLDSAVYYVSNFSLDPVARLSLPIYEVFRYDSLEHKPLEAQLALKLTIDPLPENLAFKDNNVYQPIPTEFNVFVLVIVLVVLLVVAAVVLFFFGKKLKRMWQNWLEKRKYKRFLSRWEKAELAFASQPDMDHADELLGLWKTYMEHLNEQPFREWTTTEISEFLDNKDIIKDFRAIESIIYAGQSGKDISENCQNLREVCAMAFQKKITEPDESK